MSLGNDHLRPRSSTEMEPDEGFTLISTGPEAHTSASSPSSRDINGDERDDEGRNTRPSYSSGPRMPVAIARIGSRIKKPILLILVAILDALVSEMFLFLFFLNNPGNTIPSSSGHRSILLPLIIFGFFRAASILLLSLRKNWSARGKMWTTVSFTGTGLGVLWEVNLSVLYRGWHEDEGIGKAGMGKWKIIYLVLQMVLASLEYIAYALSLHFATREGHHLSFTATQARNRQRATSIRFEESDVFLDRPRVYGRSADGLLTPGPPQAFRSWAEEERVDTLRHLGDDDDEDHDEERDSATSSDHNDPSNDSDDDDASTDPDEIIDLPLPVEARIERKTSQLSLRRRGPLATRMGTGRGRESQGSSVASVEADSDSGELDGVHGRGSGGGGVWASVREFLGLGKGTDSRSEVRASRSGDGYGTI